MPKKALKKHIDELHNTSKIDEKTLKSFIEKYEILGSVGINSNSMFYILNLNSMSYEYVNDACSTFTGYTPKDFKKQGLNLIHKIIIKNDYKLLSEVLFPKMNAFSKDLSTKEKENIVFEIYYKMVNKNTGAITQMVEFSSYSKFDDKGNPILSTGMCYQSIQNITGVKGIVRINTENKQKILFHEDLTDTLKVLTKTERETCELLTKGLSRKKIAETKNVSLHTVNTHIKKAYKKLDVNKVSELVSKFQNS